MDLIEQIKVNFNLIWIWYILLFPLFFVWIIWIIHTAIDIIRRTDNIFFELFCIILVTFTWPLWWLLYLVIRPKFTLEEIVVHEAILTSVQECFKCWQLNNLSHKYCINCWEELKIKCKECGKEYYRWYWYCPYCSAPNIEN